MDNLLSRIIELMGNKHGAGKELADYLGIHASVITDWKSGRNKSYPKYASAIAEYYGVSLDWLSGNTEEKEKPIPPQGYELSELDLKLINELPKMTTQAKMMMLAQIEAYKKLK